MCIIRLYVVIVVRHILYIPVIVQGCVANHLQKLRKLSNFRVKFVVSFKITLLEAMFEI